LEIADQNYVGFDQRDATGERSVSLAKRCCNTTHILRNAITFDFCRNGLSSHPFGAAVARLAHIWVSGSGGERMAGFPFGGLEPLNWVIQYAF